MREGDILAGQYRLCERVGRGSYGVVWRAEEVRGGRAIVAVKVFHDQPDEAEMAMLARLDHPNILRYRATIEHEGQLCLVTDFADGGDVFAMRESYPRGLPAEDVRRIMLAVALALRYLHEMRVVHRDVKPHNLLYVNGVVRLADVGLAKALERTSTQGTRSASPTYGAPDLYEGRITTKVDIYSWGITAYELLTGQPPFTGSLYQVMDLHRYAPVPELPTIVPEPLRSLVHRALAKVPAERPEAEELARELESPSFPPPQPTPPPPPPTCRWRRLWNLLPWAEHPWRRLTLVLAVVTASGILSALLATMPLGRRVVYAGAELAWMGVRSLVQVAEPVAWCGSEWFRLVGMMHYSYGDHREAYENFRLAHHIAPFRAEPAFNLAVTTNELYGSRDACEYLRWAIEHARPGETELRALARETSARWGCP